MLQVLKPQVQVQVFETTYHVQLKCLNKLGPIIAKANKKFELMLTGRAKAYSSFCSQTVSLSAAISSHLLRRYRSLMPSCASFLKPKKSKFKLSKFTFNATNFISILSISILISFGAICFQNVSCNPKSPKN